MAYPYLATVLFMLSVGYASSLIGSYFLIEYLAERFPLNLIWASALALVYVVVLELLFLRFVRSKWREVRLPRAVVLVD
jgi:hypothetical protein